MTVATQIRGVVVGWQLYQLTHDPLVLGLIGLAEALPFIATALFAGHAADTTDRRWLTLVAMVALLCCAAALLALVVSHPVSARDVPWFYLIIGVIFTARGKWSTRNAQGLQKNRHHRRRFFWSALFSGATGPV